MTRYQRSVQIWTLLVVAAKERKSYSYGDVAEILGMGGWRTSAVPWSHHVVLRRPGASPHTVPVVNQDTGLPGEGLTTLENVNEDREHVFIYDWFSVEPPETNEFEKADRAQGSAPRSFRHNSIEGASEG